MVRMIVMKTPIVSEVVPRTRKNENSQKQKQQKKSRKLKLHTEKSSILKAVAQKKKDEQGKGSEIGFFFLPHHSLPTHAQGEARTRPANPHTRIRAKIRDECALAPRKEVSVAQRSLFVRAPEQSPEARSIFFPTQSQQEEGRKLIVTILQYRCSTVNAASDVRRHHQSPLPSDRNIQLSA